MRDSNMAGCSPRPDRADAPSRPGPLRSALSGEQIRGDLLTATTWSWFAAAESHNRMSQNQANMVEVPGLSYGLFHAVAQLVCSWGIVRQVKFPGVNLDIGHIRNLGWAKDNDRQKWIGYNRLRGQYMSALEHAIPELFFNDPTSCNIEGSTTQTPGLPACPKGVSAVQALGTAAQAGQKIYTITQEVYNNNPNIVSSALSAHSADTRSAVQNALNAGLEVTIHEKPVTIGGWIGAGSTMIDLGSDSQPIVGKRSERQACQSCCRVVGTQMPVVAFNHGDAGSTKLSDGEQIKAASDKVCHRAVADAVRSYGGRMIGRCGSLFDRPLPGVLVPRLAVRMAEDR